MLRYELYSNTVAMRPQVMIANNEVWQMSGSGFGNVAARTGVILYLNDGHGLLSLEPNSFRDERTQRSCACIEVCDLDGDGDQELIAGYGDITSQSYQSTNDKSIVGGYAKLYTNVAPAAVVTKASASELAGPGSTSHAALVDMDGDSDLDVRSAANGYLLLWSVTFLARCCTLSL